MYILHYLFTRSERFWVAFAAAASWLSVFVTIYLVRKQSRISEKDLHIRTQLNLEDSFNSSRMVKARKQVAKEILDKGQDPWEPVMEFFESMGMLLRKNSLDAEMVWGTFSFYIIGWWVACKPFIDRYRKLDSEMYSDFKLLVEKMYKIDKAKAASNNKHINIIPSKEKIEEFLINERDQKLFQ
jgi:hypothetical protein